MCYALPGPRCSNHCFNDLAKARFAYVAAVEQVHTDPQTRQKFEDAKARLERAQARFDRTPEGQRLLREEAVSLRYADPERAAALEALADKGDQIRTKEVGASKKKALAEQRAFLDLQRKTNEAWEETRKVSERVSEQATPQERARLEQLEERARTFLDQSSTTPLGLKIIKDDLRLARQNYAAATTDEDRTRAEKAVRFHAAHLAESKKKRERMIAESKASDGVRAQADRIMAQERAKDGLQTNLIMTPAEEKVCQELMHSDAGTVSRHLDTNRDLSPAVLHALRKHQDLGVQSAVANHQNVSNETLSTMMLHRPPVYAVITQSMHRNLISPSVQQQASLSGRPHLVKAVARFGHDSKAIRQAFEAGAVEEVSENEHTPRDLLKKIAEGAEYDAEHRAQAYWRVNGGRRSDARKRFNI